MSGKAQVFVQRDTGEKKEFTPEDYVIEQTTNFSKQREFERYSFLRAEDGHRIERKPDGSYMDKWNAVWVPQSTR
jgi:hypothetical protein